MLIIKPNDPKDLPRIRTGALTSHLKELFHACKNVEFAVAPARGIRATGEARYR